MNTRVTVYLVLSVVAGTVWAQEGDEDRRSFERKFEERNRSSDTPCPIVRRIRSFVESLCTRFQRNVRIAPSRGFGAWRRVPPNVRKGLSRRLGDGWNRLPEEERRRIIHEWIDLFREAPETLRREFMDQFMKEFFKPRPKQKRRPPRSAC